MTWALSLEENLFLQKNPLQDLLSSLITLISTNESTQFITGHVIYNLPYTYKFQLKTTNDKINFIFSCHLVLIVGSFEFALFQESHVENWDEVSNVHLWKL